MTRLFDVVSCPNYTYEVGLVPPSERFWYYCYSAGWGMAGLQPYDTMSTW